MRHIVYGLLLCFAGPLAAGIPATLVMTLYRFNGPLDLPYYDVDDFQRNGASAPAGTLAQGTSVIPCLVIRNGSPLTDRDGTPFVGFEVVVDSRAATRASAETFKKALAERRSLTVADHRCDRSVRHVLDVRNLYAMEKAPFFDPPRPAGLRAERAAGAGGSCRGAACRDPDGERRELDAIIRAFHDSAQCEQANRALVGRRDALAQAWGRFSAESEGRWAGAALERARQLDYAMRTVLYEGHLGRGCTAYGACERNVIALSIRNRGSESCSRRQGCRSPGDFQGVASEVSQYNIWDELLTQVSGLTSCFLRRDLSGEHVAAAGGEGPGVPYYTKLARMYEQSLGDVHRILFGDDGDLAEVFPGVPVGDLRALRHYYHAPAMGKCFPEHDRVEYVTGAVAAKGDAFALIANTRIHVDGKSNGGYLFREFVVKDEADRDVTTAVDRYPGFVVDARKVTLKGPSRCAPYGIPGGCKLERVGRYRRTPPWLGTGRPLELACRVGDRGESCQADEAPGTARVGGTCDKEMRPVAGVP
jgi:hypothetical protein